MTWEGLGEDIQDMFSELSGVPSREEVDSFGEYHHTLFDPHRAADAWIAASDSERIELRVKAESELTALVRHRGSEMRREAFDYQERRVSIHRKCVREYDQLHKDEARARCRAYAARNREKRRLYNIAYRAAKRDAA